jgi:hypothetical protein
MARSSFGGFTIYRANPASDFDLIYFRSFRYYYSYYYALVSHTIDVDIYSSLLFPGDSFIQGGNPFAEHYEKTETGIRLLLYLISNDTVLTKKYYFEMDLENSVLSSPGKYRSEGSWMPVSLAIRNREGQVLFSSSEGADSFLDFEVVEIKDNILYGVYSGKLGSVSNRRTIYYDIYDGEIWIRL